jgi:hypothetical protein
MKNKLTSKRRGSKAAASPQSKTRARIKSRTATESRVLIRCYDPATEGLFGEFEMVGEERKCLFDRAAASGYPIKQFIESALREKIARSHCVRPQLFVNAVLPDYVTFNRLAAITQYSGADMGRIAGAAIRKVLNDPKMDALMKQALGIPANPKR